MIVGKIKKDFLNGLDKISLKRGCNVEQIQVKLSFGESQEKPIVYHLCQNWVSYEESTYKAIMDKKFDLIGEEGLATPYLLQSMAKLMQEFSVEPTDFSVYLMEFKGTIMVAVFDKVNCLKTLPIEKLFD